MPDAAESLKKSDDEKHGRTLRAGLRDVAKSSLLCRVGAGAAARLANLEA